MKKRLLAVAATAAIAAVLTAGSTMAYLQAATDPKNNVFTASANISIKLAEPEWNGYDFEDFDEAVPPQGKKPEHEGSVGIEQAKRYVPGDVIAKNPMIQNTSDKDIYVAIKVEYYGAEEDTPISYEDFTEQYGSIDFDTQQWTEITVDGILAKEFFIYNHKLLAAAEQQFQQTTALFDKVTMAPRADAIDMLGSSFKVVISAYAVIAEGTEEVVDGIPVYQTELLKMGYMD